MMRLAKYYQADRLLQHCERHLRMCREMPAEERMELAKKYGSKELQVIVFDSKPQKIHFPAWIVVRFGAVG